MGRKTIGRFVNAALQTAAANSNLVFNSNTISTNSLAYDGAGGIQLKTAGVYMIYASFTGVATSANTDIRVNMQENGVDVPGATATGTIGTVGNSVNLAFTAVTTVWPSLVNEYATLTFKSVPGANYSNVCIIVEKVA